MFILFLYPKKFNNGDTNIFFLYPILDNFHLFIYPVQILFNYLRVPSGYLT